MLNAFFWAAGAVLTLMTLVWAISLQKRDASIVDIVWGPAFVLAAWVYQWKLPAGDGPWRLVPLAFVTIWGLRLAAHIASRHSGEDRRYVEMRRKRPDSFTSWSLYGIFWFQGALASVISLPLLFALCAPRPQHFTVLDAVAIAVFLIGFTFEALGDWQLTRFKADPSNRGRVLDTGLWRYTRHPNYFGDAAVWWSFGLFASVTEGGLYTWPSVLLMTFFLLKVSGVALLEKDISERRPAYRDYIERTPAFIPWFPKKKAGAQP
ncbi:MAG: DUF1295 domain-containing protein [Acidobacteriota bacterium]